MEPKRVAVIVMLISSVVLTNEPSLFAAEGFYALDAIPSAVVSDYALSPTTIARSAKFTGIFLSTRKMKLDAKRVAQMNGWFCSTDESRKVEGAFCEKISQKSCAKGCDITVQRAKCAGVRLGDFFAVSKHCVAEVAPLTEPKALFIAPDGSENYFSLEVTPKTLGDEPYDLSVFKLKGLTGNAGGAGLKIAAPSDGEIVFGIGVPFLGYRANLESKGYPTTFGVRVTFGKVINPNSQVKSFCQYTNDDADDIEQWVLEDRCSPSRTAGRGIEHDPFLTDTDMTYGMSGSPLFNAKGELIGIGSNVLSKTPENYTPGKFAIYDKAVHVQELIDALTD